MIGPLVVAIYAVVSLRSRKDGAIIAGKLTLANCREWLFSIAREGVSYSDDSDKYHQSSHKMPEYGV